MSDRVTISIHEGVADVRLNRADKMNALDSSMFEALYESGRSLAEDASVRAVVLSGEGRGFCAGLDVGNFAGAMGGAGNGRSLFDKPDGSIANYAQLGGWVWQDLPVPVIAAIHGVAYGGGCQIALGADIRFVTPDARLSVMEIKWGLVPDMSGTQTLRNLVRLDIAKELTFTGRIVSGSEAVELGLATHVSDDPHRDAMEMATTIAGRSPSAVRAGKRLLNESAVGSYESGLQLEAELQGNLLGKPDQIETVKAQMEGRVARYDDTEDGR